MRTTRLEAFSDGVLAILITIMVLELKVPHGATLAALQPLIPVVLSYVLSFVYLGIYWNNHHHLFQVAERVSGSVLWANLHLLFWLSLVPFTTAWMGENHFARMPMALYGTVLLMAGVAYALLERALMAVADPEAPVARALRSTWKDHASPVLYLLGIGGAFVHPWIAGAFYVGVALLWLIPDPRMERAAAQQTER